MKPGNAIVFLGFCVIAGAYIVSGGNPGAVVLPIAIVGMMLASD